MTSRGDLQIAPVAPDLFAANANGEGVAAATALRVENGSTATVPVFSCGSEPLSCRPLPISVDGGAVYVSLYATEVRAASDVSVSVGGVPAQVLYAGPQRQFVGLDQVNIVLPISLRGKGTVEIRLQAGGVLSNTVTIAVL